MGKYSLKPFCARIFLYEVLKLFRYIVLSRPVQIRALLLTQRKKINSLIIVVMNIKLDNPKNRAILQIF